MSIIWVCAMVNKALLFYKHYSFKSRIEETNTLFINQVCVLIMHCHLNFKASRTFTKPCQYNTNEYSFRNMFEDTFDIVKSPNQMLTLTSIRTSTTFNAKLSNVYPSSYLVSLKQYDSVIKQFQVLYLTIFHHIHIKS